jgi:uncharacterized protein RhaS with RHS repeats
MYSPTLGRLSQTDPVGYADDLNWYAYVGNNPVNFSDPLGLAVCSDKAAKEQQEEHALLDKERAALGQSTISLIFQLPSERDMEESKLSVLLRKIVMEADLMPEDAGLLFEGEIALNLYNRCIVTGQIGSGTDAIIGAKVIKVTETAERAIFEFDSGVRIEVDLTDDAYTSPEAMQLRVPGSPILIWN